MIGQKHSRERKNISASLKAKKQTAEIPAQLILKVQWTPIPKQLEEVLPAVSNES